jgi:hypothetical protein
MVIERKNRAGKRGLSIIRAFPLGIVPYRVRAKITFTVVSTSTGWPLSR